MSANKTIATTASVGDFIEAVVNDQKRKDSHVLVSLMKEISGEEPVMWGPSIIGFGSYHYKYDSGREGDMPIIGFSPRVQSLTLYVGASTKYNKSLLNKLGKHSLSKACLYIKKLEDIDINVLKELIKTNYAFYKKKYNS